MIQFLIDNLPTILVSLLLALIVAAVIVKLVKDKKQGKSAGCGCGCKGCPNSAMCHSGEQTSRHQISK